MASKGGRGSRSTPSTVRTAAPRWFPAYSRMRGRKVSGKTKVPAHSGPEPTVGTPPEVAKAQRQLAMLQYAVPALTGALVVISAFAGEQQRASEVKKGVMSRLVP